MKVNPELENDQRKRLASFRKNRNANLHKQTLQKLKEKAAGKENLVPHILSCAENHVTLGEISDTLRSVFGIYQP